MKVSFKAESVTVFGVQLAALITSRMIEQGVTVACEPFPNDAYTVSVKLEAYSTLQKVCDDLVVPSPKELSGKMVVVLASCGNPDFRQYAPISTPQNHIVASLDEARQACCDYIEENELGAGNWAGGSVLCDGEFVAHIAYNGTIIPTATPA